MRVFTCHYPRSRGIRLELYVCRIDCAKPSLILRADIRRPSNEYEYYNSIPSDVAIYWRLTSDRGGNSSVLEEGYTASCRGHGRQP
jgi:acyl CoA:acetate/3-ketoacid CoA transferase